MCVCVSVYVGVQLKQKGGLCTIKKVSSCIGTGNGSSEENEYEQRTMITSVKHSDRTHYLLCERKILIKKERERGNPC